MPRREGHRGLRGFVPSRHFLGPERPTDVCDVPFLGRNSFLWRMFACRHQHATKVDQRLAIQLQRLNRCASDWGQAEDLSSIVTPREMFLPLMFSRVKQSNIITGNRVASPRSIVFVIVAALARERGIGGRPFALSTSRPDVFQRETLMSKRGRAATILTTPTGAASDELPQRDLSLSHGWVGARFPFASSTIAVACGATWLIREAPPHDPRRASLLLASVRAIRGVHPRSKFLSCAVE